MFIVKKKITEKELAKKAEPLFKGMLKFVVDIHKKVIAIDAGMHADLEQLLLENGSKQLDLWGGNYYFDKPNDKNIIYESLINIRPALGNRSMLVNSKKIKDQIKAVVDKFISRK